MDELLTEALDGERVDRIVAMFADVSRSTAARAIEQGLVSIDGDVVTTRSLRVGSGQTISISDSVGEPAPPLSGDDSVDVDELYIDPDVIVVDKRAGQVVHPGAGHETGTIVQGLLAEYPEMADVGERDRPGVVHRLDRGTSGVFVFARSQLAYESLTAQLADRTVRRRYSTLVWGTPNARDGRIDAPLGRAVRDPTRIVVRDDGKRAVTSYHVAAMWDDPKVALLACELETGRTHQIRVHLEAIGHPVVGDRKYGGQRAPLAMDRPALHAELLGFEHPSTGEYIEFVSELPSDMTDVMAGLGPPDWGSAAP